ncbi:WhiB family transcriptional regulator [Agromyces sp. G08B096]|uniref:Transcriptional regulator WhiB n=1 Tax=Agromyces sp. G08B096 TaxID=3156399 RepID=A0AAU7W423_9MICO
MSIPLPRITPPPSSRGEDPERWKELATCAQISSDPWFPEAGGDGGAQAKAICATCPVRQQCLDYAIEHHERYGIWGGLGRDERARYAREKAAA